MKRVICLYRVSTMKQVEDNDLPMQREACRAFAAQHPDWKIIDEKYEKGVSGFKIRGKDRDAVAELLVDAEGGTFDVLLVYMMDRLGRIADDTPVIAKTIASCGVEIWSVMEGQQHFDTQSDHLMNYIRSWAAECESVKTSMRTKTRLAQIVLEGRFRGGKAPYGYRLEKQGPKNIRGHEVYEILVNEEEAPVVAHIFALSALNGYGSRKIATVLTEEGYRNRNGKPFHPSTIQNMLKNVLYTGVLRSGESRSEVFPHLQIVPEMVFNHVQAQIQQHRSDYEGSRLSPVARNGQALLSGNVFCGTCGGRLISTTTRSTHHPKKGVNPRVPIYRCYNRIQHKELCDGQSTYRADKVDTVVETAVCQILDRIRVIDQKDYLKKRRQQELNAARVKLRQLESAYNRAVEERKQLSSHMVDVLEGKSPFTAEDLKERMDEAKAMAEEFAQQMEAQKVLLRETQLRQEAVEEHFQQLKGYAQVYQDATMEEKRRIVSALIERVTVSRGYEIHIQFRVGLDVLNNLDD